MLPKPLNKGLNEEAVQKRLADLGADIAEPNRGRPAAMANLVRSDVARLTLILGIVPEAVMWDLVDRRHTPRCARCSSLD